MNNICAIRARFTFMCQAALFLLTVTLMYGCQYRTEIPRAVIHFELEQNASAIIGVVFAKFAAERGFYYSDFSRNYPSNETINYIELENEGGTVIQAIDQMDGKRFVISVFADEERWLEYTTELFKELEATPDSKVTIQYPES